MLAEEMTLKDLRTERQRVIELLSQGHTVPEILDRLEDLDKESRKSTRDSFYDFVNTLDEHCRLLNASQGDSAAIVAALDLITAHCATYRAVLIGVKP